MRALQKLVRNGNSTQVTIPRPALFWLGWLPGEAVILEVLENKSLLIRRPASDEFMPNRAKTVVLDRELPYTP